MAVMFKWIKILTNIEESEVKSMFRIVTVENMNRERKFASVETEG